MIGSIFHDEYLVCSGSLIGKSIIVSVSSVLLTLRPDSLIFKTRDEEIIKIISYDQFKTLSDHVIISFKLESEIGQKIGYLGVLSFEDKEKYESYDFKNMESCIQIPYK